MRFSVITVTYNNLEGLTRTAESLRAQSCRDYEWIVIDGGSQDGTVDFLKTTAADWVSEEDHGIYDAMNKGIERSSGDYLLFLNAGDLLAAPDVLEALSGLICSYTDTRAAPPDFIYGDAREDGHYKTARPHSDIARGLFTHHQAMLYRRALVDEQRYDTFYKIAADYKFTACFLEKSAHILYESQPFCIFESGGLSQRQTLRGRQEQLHIRRALKMVTPLQNIGIYTAQGCACALRRRLPRLYWRLRTARTS